MLTLVPMALAAPIVDVASSAHRFEVHDTHQSPRPYAIWGAGLQARMAAPGGVGWLTEVVLDAGSSAARGGGPSFTSVHGRLSLGAAPALWRTDTAHIRVGALLTQSFHYLDELGYFPWAAPMTSLDAVARVALSLGPGLLRGQIALPVVGAVTRPIWSLNPVAPDSAPLVEFFRQGTRLTGVPRVVAPRIGATYTVGRGTWRPHLGLDVTTFRVPFPSAVRRVQTRALLGLTRGFRGGEP
ncbi:MAG: hypothetical protein AAF602_29610 [Myxococcota bacterium]